MAGTECGGREEDGIHTDSIEDPKPDKGQQAPLQQCSPKSCEDLCHNFNHFQLYCYHFR